MFLDELKSKVEQSLIPMEADGDFNLIHSHEDKSSANMDLPLMW